MTVKSSSRTEWQILFFISTLVLTRNIVKKHSSHNESGIRFIQSCYFPVKSCWQCWVWLTKIHAWACLDLKQHLISAKTWWAWSYHDFWLGHLAISNRILRDNSLHVGTEFSKRAWRGTAVRDTSFLTMIQQSYGIVYVRNISHL